MITNSNTKKNESEIDGFAKPAYSILIVDDRPENLLTLQSVLEDGKRNFLTAESGNEALKIALHEPLSLIMMDIQMPEIDGIETARLLRLNQRTKHIPILFVSAISPKEKHPLVGFEPGTVDFLFKPLDLPDTRNKVAFFEKLWKTTLEFQELKKNSEGLKKDFDRFVYMVSHDLKAPLRAITNLASWIGEEMPVTTNQNVIENLSLLKERVQRLHLMIDGILDYSRAGRIDESPENTDIKKLVHSIFESFLPSGGFTLTTTGTWPQYLFTEKLKLEKVFRCLLGNSIQHHDKTEGEVNVLCEQEKKILRFTVTDDGPGIKPLFYSTIFEMFQTLNPKDEKQTTGVGLAIAKKIIEEKGGTISVVSIEPKGTSFTFTWPL